jgi:parallel beta-helix repeat protein
MEADGPGNVVRKNVLGDRPSASVNQSLYLGDCRNARVEANIVQNGIVLARCQDARVVNNSLPASGIEGIRVDGGSGNLIERNTLSSIEETGIWIAGGSENSVDQNTISDTRGSGVFVGTCCGRSDPPSVGTAVEGNLVFRAGFDPDAGDQRNDGIHVDDPGTTIAANRANDNADYGIQAVSGVIDGGGNTASGNGNPLQCLNVVCG